MRHENILDAFTSVDMLEIVKEGKKIVQIHEGIVYRKKLKVSPFRKIIEKMLALRTK